MTSFNMSNGGGGSFGGYDQPKGYGSMAPYQDEYNEPQIYRAVYSNISVYEMEVNGVAVMKRRSDAWLNATQILKVAGVVKARRTKTLEKEIAAGEHEKVQGGYGKYQGTWVNYKRGVELCREYHVDELLRPLLEYDMNADGSGPAQGTLDTPTKEQAMAAQRKRMYNGGESRSSSQPQQGTFFQNISSTAATAVNAISKARFDSPSANSRRPSVIRKPSQQMSSQESQMAFSSQQSMYNMSDSGFSSLQNRYPTQDENDTCDFVEPPRKRVRSSSHHTPSFGLHREPSNLSNISMHEPTPTEPNESFYQDVDLPPPPMDDGKKRGIPALGAPTTPDHFQKMKLIMTLFLDKRIKDFTNHPALVQLTGEDLEIPLDEYRNSALHWAAMLARMPLVHALVAKGANISRLNGAGETALQKSVGTRNNLDYRSFPRLLQVLAPTIDMIDYSGRTILHHISVMAATGGGGHVSAKHYLESLLEFIIRNGGGLANSLATANGDHQQNGSSGNDVISLGRFISEIVNLRDDRGDTALNMAGRARSKLIAQLLEVGADPSIPNNTGLAPADYGVGVDLSQSNDQSHQASSRRFMDQLAKTKQEIFSSTLAQVTSIFQEALEGIDRELTAKWKKQQEVFDHWHAKIRESARLRQIEQKELDEIKAENARRALIERQIANLARASEALEKDTKATGVDVSCIKKRGDFDRILGGMDRAKFKALFPDPDPAHFDASKLSDEQKAFLSSTPPHVLKAQIEVYNEIVAGMRKQIEELKAKDVILGENYRRMVMACTDWTADKVDDAAEGLTECVKELDANPVPEDEAIEILMQDRGQDW